MSELSPNTQAILLLTAPLIAGRGGSSEELLSHKEYQRLARHLREKQREPVDLLAPEAGSIFGDCESIVDPKRLEKLLARGFLLSQVVERWRSRAIWVISRADASYPRRIKVLLKDDAPPVLYGCGEIALLEGGGLAVVGSRNVDEGLMEYAMGIGRLVARAGRTLVSGAARGIDQAAMRGALEDGGTAIGVLADSLEKTAMNRENRNLLIDGRLVLVSPYDPSAGFNVGNAMRRNRLIYALADAALVANADLERGGTWAGATEQLDKFRFVPVYVRSNGEPSQALEALQRKGAIAWPNPANPDELETVLAATVPTSALVQEALPLATSDPISNEVQPTGNVLRKEEPAVYVVGPGATASADRGTVEESAADVLFRTAKQLLLEVLDTPKKEKDVAALLGITGAQAKVWLRRLVDEGMLEKKKARYLIRQTGLFG